MRATFWTCLFLSACSVPPQEAPQKPADNALDFVFVTVCSWRVDRIGVYGNTPNTPHFDAFAKDAVVFENAYANATFTDASHASMFTGLYPAHEGLLDFGNGINPSAHTLPEILKLYGYRTQPFLDEKSQLNPKGILDMSRGFGKPEFAPSDNIHGAVTEWARSDRTPWIAWIHLRRAHVPYGEGPEFESQLDSRVVDWLHSQNPTLRKDPKGQPGRRMDPNTLFLQALKAPEVQTSLEKAYSLGLQAADAQLGELLEGLQADGMLDHTVVVVVGDHGESLGDQGHLMHQGSLIDAVLHVPMMVRIPGIAPRRERTLVSLVDLLPTLADLAGAVTPTGLDGRSLLPLLKGQPLEDRPVLSQAVRLFGDEHHTTLRNSLISPPYQYLSDVNLQELWKRDEAGIWNKVEEPEQATKMQAQMGELSKNSMWDEVRPQLPEGVREQLRRNGYW